MDYYCPNGQMWRVHHFKIFLTVSGYYLKVTGLEVLKAIHSNKGIAQFNGQDIKITIRGKYMALKDEYRVKNALDIFKFFRNYNWVITLDAV